MVAVDVAVAVSAVEDAVVEADMEAVAAEILDHQCQQARVTKI